MPVSGTRNWTDVRQFNLMFATEMGSTSEGANKIYLRPETAQGIFVNFLNVQKTGRMKIPFGIAQIGKAFRNEIVARQFIFRMREFEQMEMQFFVQPGSELEWFKKWKEIRMKWHQALGFGSENYRFHDHVKLAHYANAATDIEFKFPFGFKEVEGIHSRTDYDLKQHQEYSGKKMQYFDPEKGESYIPFVIETSIGVDRMFLQVISAAYNEEVLKKEDGTSDTRLLLRAVSRPGRCCELGRRQTEHDRQRRDGNAATPQTFPLAHHASFPPPRPSRATAQDTAGGRVPSTGRSTLREFLASRNGSARAGTPPEPPSAYMAAMDASPDGPAPSEDPAPRPGSVRSTTRGSTSSGSRTSTRTRARPCGTRLRSSCGIGWAGPGACSIPRAVAASS